MLAVAGSLAVGCGGGDDASEFEGTDEEQVAATVRIAAEAMRSGDGETACDLISDRGQQLAVRVVNRDVPGAEVNSCESAIAMARGKWPGDVRRGLAAVSISQDDPDVAQVECGYGAVVLMRTDGAWRIGAPFCVG